MKYFFLLHFFIITIFAQPIYFVADDNEKEIPFKHGVAYYDGHLYSGIGIVKNSYRLIELMGDTIFEAENNTFRISFFDGQPNGLFEHYNNDMMLVYRGYVNKHYIKFGLNENWDSNGILYSSIEYINGVACSGYIRTTESNLNFTNCIKDGWEILRESNRDTIKKYKVIYSHNKIISKELISY